ncbi:hypothetical protein DY052_06300 [Apilactobacillus timberlakei]|uniref:hypothetical protein n=1 Tax=Apilactobacillus timberlakei TaxID=2008380 RepID=UPI0011286034|nr:hypothetical protein [Apilactobacillus timberlakei]TPR15035.1 hypothetical protein DY052_06300 [Apilactobacillus timberlakei]
MLFSQKQIRGLIILITTSMILIFLNGVFSFYNAKNDLHSISENYQVFIKNIQHNPNKLKNTKIYFYRSSCNSCQKKIPASYFLYAISYPTSSEVHFYDVDKQDNSYIKNSLNVNEVPTAYTFDEVNGFIHYQRNNILDSSFIISTFIMFLCNSLLVSLIIFMLGFFIVTYMEMKHLSTNSLIKFY